MILGLDGSILGLDESFRPSVASVVKDKKQQEKEPHQKI
jgi:hypothetical protein